MKRMQELKVIYLPFTTFPPQPNKNLSFCERKKQWKKNGHEISAIDMQLWGNLKETGENATDLKCKIPPLFFLQIKQRLFFPKRIKEAWSKTRTQCPKTAPIP